jgi:hypothetical protein
MSTLSTQSTGSHGEAMHLLNDAASPHQPHPADRDVLLALVSIARDQGTW